VAKQPIPGGSVVRKDRCVLSILALVNGDC